MSSNTHVFKTVCLGIFVAGLLGCDSQSGPSNKDVGIAASLASGYLLLESSDWQGADRELTIALDSKTLSGDRYEEALIARAKARVRGEKLDGAAEDLAILEQGASAMDLVLALKAEMLQKKGDAAGAKAAAVEARKINSKIELPKGL